MDAIIIAGGLGTRLFPLTLSTPKSCIPLLDVPLINYPMALAKEFGCERVVIAGGHLVDKIKQAIFNDKSGAVKSPYKFANEKIEFSEEAEPMGTGGAVAKAINTYALQAPLLVMNGDVVTDMSPKNFLKAYKKYNHTTILGCEIKNHRGFGVLEIDESGIVSSFREKEEVNANQTAFINGGVYILEKDAVESILHQQGEFALETTVFPELAEKGKLYSFKHSGFWRDVGTLNSFFFTQFDILGYWLTTGRKMFFGERDNFALFKDFIYIHSQANICKGCDLFHRVIAMRGCLVGTGSRLQNVILLPYAEVGKDCHLSNVIVDAGTTVPDGSSISDRVISRDREELLVL